VQFTRTDTVPELYVAADAAGAPPGRLLYLLPKRTPSSPSTLSFADAWAAGGTFLFLAQAADPTALPALAARAWTFLADPRLEHARFAWLENATGFGLLQGTTLQVADLGAGPVVAFDATIALRNVALELPRGSSVTVDDAGCAFGFGGASLSSGWGRATAGTIEGPVTLGLVDALQGCLRFRLDLGPVDLDLLDVGQRWFYGRPPDPAQPLAPARAFFLASQRFPLFAGALVVYPSLDPLAPLDETRTFMAFDAADAGLTGPPPTSVPTYLRSTLDDTVSLAPLGAHAAPRRFAALVFAVVQQSSAASIRDPLSLEPCGDFALDTARAGGAELMGGLSGVEYFALGTNVPVLSYVPGGPAFADGFLPEEPAGVTALQPTDMPTTAYAAIGAEGTAVEYYAQPDASVLYNYGSAAVGGVSSITALAPVAVHAATLADPPTSAVSFPMLAFAGVQNDLPAARQLEAQVVSPARRNALAAAPPQATVAALGDGEPGGPPPSALSTTPQGLLASYVPGGDPTRWESVVLAQMALAAPATSGQLLLTDVDGSLLTAFQSNKMFLVASDPGAIAPYLTSANARITVGADPAELWQFDLDPNCWSAYRTILIVKFFDRSIEELSGQPAAWSSAGAFNVDPDATARQIALTIDEAKASLAAGDADYAAFVAAVTDPSWNGILALSVRSPLTDLPSEMEGLAVGIDPARFTAHHVGIEASKISVPDPASGEAIGISSSSIFGLVDYRAEAPLPPHVADWAFQVETLKVLFRHSAVAAFSSVVDLQVNTLFGEPATLEGAAAGDNVVTLYGAYQKSVVNGAVVESYTFETQGDAVFDMSTSQVLNAVVVRKAQFVTVTSETTDSSVQSQFQFWGLLDFKSLASADGRTPFDVFSFGRAHPEDPPAGLVFGNLILAMAFDPTVTPEVPAFTFDASALALDVSSSVAREASLFEHFPVTVARVEQADLGSTPTGCGFMGVQTPLTQTALSFPWYALDFDLDLGSPGALAGQAGFVATLTAAWSPATGPAYRVFTGLKLPGSSGSKRAVSIESLLDITFKSLEIVVPSPGAFILVLYGIGFSFLSLTFPPSGQVNFALFGDPAAQGKGGASMGWYAAYAKDGAGQQGGGQAAIVAAAPQLEAANP
jgi:hypothetical protein